MSCSKCGITLNPSESIRYRSHFWEDLPIVPIVFSIILTVVAAALLGTGFAYGMLVLILPGGLWFIVLLGGLQDRSMRKIAVVNLSFGVPVTSIMFFAAQAFYLS